MHLPHAGRPRQRSVDQAERPVLEVVGQSSLPLASPSPPLQLRHNPSLGHLSSAAGAEASSRSPRREK